MNRANPVDEYLDSIRHSVEGMEQERHKRLLLALQRSVTGLVFSDLVSVIGEPKLQVAMDLVELRNSGKIQLNTKDHVTSIQLTEAGRGDVNRVSHREAVRASSG